MTIVFFHVVPEKELLLVFVERQRELEVLKEIINNNVNDFTTMK